MSSRLLIAVIGAPHGIHGEIRVKSYAASPEDLFGYEVFYTNTGDVCSIKMRRVIAPDMLIASIKGVTTRDAAESFKGVHLYLERAQLSPLPEESDEFYYCDLEGLEVKTTQGLVVGKIQVVNNYGGGDFLEIATPDNKLFTLPFTKEAVLEMHLEDGFIIINSEYLLT